MISYTVAGSETWWKWNHPLNRRKLKNFTDFEFVLKCCLQPCKRLVSVIQTKVVVTTKKNAKLSGDSLARLQEEVRFWEFGNLKTVADPQAYMVQLAMLSDCKIPNTKRNYSGVSKVNPKQLLMTSYWLFNSANKPLNSSASIPSQPKVFVMSATAVDRTKLTGPVTKQTMSRFF